MPSSQRCFVCGLHNEHGLQLLFERHGDAVLTSFRLARHHNGFGDRAHGGLVAAVLDEVMGWATVLAGDRFTYTAELTVRYKQPVPTGQELQLKGWVERHTRRLSFTRAELRDRADQLLAIAQGKFAPLDADAHRAVTEELIYRPDCWRPQPF